MCGIFMSNKWRGIFSEFYDMCYFLGFLTIRTHIDLFMSNSCFSGLTFLIFLTSFVAEGCRIAKYCEDNVFVLPAYEGVYG